MKVSSEARSAISRLPVPFPGLRVRVSAVKSPPVPNRKICRCLLWLALGVSSLSAADVTVLPLVTGWREAASFKRISEYFTGRENTGGQLILRTHPDQRSGYYLLLRVTTPGTAVNAKLVLQIITPDDATPRTFNFTTTLPGPKTMLNLGLTGPDWPDLKVNPVAWKLDILTADGQLLGSGKSYLWEKPSSN